MNDVSNRDGIAMREATRADAARIAGLILMGAAKQTRTAAEIEDEAAHPAYLTAFDEVSASPHNTLFVAEIDGAVVGTLQVTLIPGLVNRGRKRAKLESVHVDPAQRSRGIGAVMVAFAVDFARRNGAGLVELTSNKSREAAHRFYRGLGFEQSHEGFKLEL
ncbi:GNAT family N-acetyltransferase [Bosea rubneri]|uniref:GNAT family N-acetyltransferase n=1 Tax=Bosea rubneri TaxID=3075434 RepID=A0ABU3S5U1_9HYPH|nr:GNAT family N-acetyltransferase [Bosea sp. ZW T0_25]MDU0340143.1 GNAT family N-acetyltransferase [Bosea sp. ZW T0_25]